MYKKNPTNRAMQIKTSSFTRKNYTGYIPKKRKILTYKALQERKELEENRLVRKVF